MIYLFIMFSVAAVGLATLWLQQKRERSHLESSEKFLSSLQKISPQVAPVRRAPRRPAGAPPGAGRQPQRAGSRTAAANRSVGMDARRREAARRRVEARRRAQGRPARSRAAS